MLKKLSLILWLSLALFARDEMSAVKTCPAFNNMKHSTNSRNLQLARAQKYPVLEHHKGQYLILLKGENPAQRWVDESCLKESNTKENSVDARIAKMNKDTVIKDNAKKYQNKNTAKQTLLALSWHNAFCETHRNRKECRRNLFMLYRSKKREHNFTLHGLWPQPANNVYCNVERKYITMDKYKHWNKLPNLGLSKETKRQLTQSMPGVHSNLHKHEWYKHGSCYGTDAETYFSDAIALLTQVQEAEVSTFFQKNTGKTVTLKQVREVFDRSFGEGAGKRVELRCRGGLISELWLHLGAGSRDLGDLLHSGTAVKSRCQRGHIDKAGFAEESNYRRGFGR